MIDLNNPGNIRPGGNWRGETGQVVKGFAVFATMPDGIAAIGKQFRAYVEGRRKTAPVIGYQKLNDAGELVWQGIIPVWAPPSENNTRSYVDWVAKIMELDPEKDALTLTDFSTCYWLTRSVGENENGRQTFDKGVTEADLQAGVNVAIAWAGPQ